MVHRQARCQTGFVALVTPNGIARTVAEDITSPNGMAVTADNLTLAVADSNWHQVLGFDISADGILSTRRVWADLGDPAPDGIGLMPRDRPGMQTYRNSLACGWPKMANIWRLSPSIAVASPAWSAGPMERPLSWSPLDGLPWQGSRGRALGGSSAAHRSLSQARVDRPLSER